MEKEKENEVHIKEKELEKVDEEIARIREDRERILEETKKLKLERKEVERKSNLRWSRKPLFIQTIIAGVVAGGLVVGFLLDHFIKVIDLISAGQFPAACCGVVHC